MPRVRRLVQQAQMEALLAAQLAVLRLSQILAVEAVLEQIPQVALALALHLLWAAVAAEEAVTRQPCRDIPLAEQGGNHAPHHLTHPQAG